MELRRVTGSHVEELNRHGLEMYRGWNVDLVDDLVAASRQPHILNKTPGDVGRRFTNFQKAALWHAEGRRTIYSLYADDPVELSGIIWGDERPYPKYGATHTFAIRLYERAVGQGHATTFMEAAYDDFEELHGSVPSIWVERNTSDLQTKHLYEKFGFVAVSEFLGRTTMVMNPVTRIMRKNENKS